MKIAPTMDIKELMIGDWIKTPKGNCRVTAIQDNDVIFTDLFEGIEGSFFADDISPILIDSDILEENGFEKQGYPGWLIYTKEYMIQWRNDYQNILSVKSFTSNYGSFERFNVNYIHEIQQIFRQCKIKNEISL